MAGRGIDKKPHTVIFVELNAWVIFQRIHRASSSPRENKMKEYFKVTAALTLFILGALGFLTFARNINKQPSVILTSTECAAPCWYGITPGQSTSLQVYSALDRVDGVDKDLILETDNKDGKPTRIFWYFQQPAEDQMGSVNIENDQATAINISTINSLTLAELFSKVGEPDKYWTGVGQRDDGEQFVDIVLLAPAKGYAAELVSDIKANTPVFRVTYFSPAMYEKLLETSILIDEPASKRSPLQDWPGYGSIPVKWE